MYQDGVLVIKETTIASSIPVNLNRVKSYIGKNTFQPDDYADTLTKSFNMWDRVLTASEISELYKYGRDCNLAANHTRIGKQTIPHNRIISDIAFVFSKQETLKTEQKYNSHTLWKPCNRW